MDKEELKKKMADQINKIEQSLPSLKEAAKPVKLDNTVVGRLSRMDALGAQAIHQKTLAQAMAKLQSLKRSIKEVDQETFGLCMECEENIDFKRLLAVPESKLCIQCAQKKSR